MEGADDPLEAPEDAAFDAFVAALARGETPQIDDWVARFGDATGELRRRLEALHWMVSAPDATADAPPFERLGDFRLIRKLGEGGMGVVWLAQQESLKRPVALKLIRAEQLGSADVEKRFAREAEAVARLRHAHIVQVYAAGEERGVRYLAMEFVDGRTLAETLNDAVTDGAPIEVPRVLRWIADVASALAEAHANGIVHRDVKPANIVIRTDGRALLADFGLARDVDSNTATLTFGFMGTPSYAAPEQIDASLGAMGPQTDVYALGATLYEAVTGVAPFSGTTTGQVLHDVVSKDVVLPRKHRATLSRDLETVILKAMERMPARRYADAAAFAADLEALLALRPIAARPPGFARRAKRYLAQRPLLTAAGALALVLAVVAPLVLSLQRRAAADAAMADAEARIVAHKPVREQLAAADQELQPRLEVFLKSWLPEFHKREIREFEAQRDAYAQQLDAAFSGAIGALEHAERLGADEDRVRRARADLYMDAWRDATERRDEPRAASIANLVRRYDIEARYGIELDGFGSLTVRTNPAGAEVWLFHYQELSHLEPGGEPRLVPVPVGDPSPAVAPGATVLRVVSAAGNIDAGDLITHVLGRPVVGVVYAGATKNEVEQFDILMRIDGERVYGRYEVDVFAETLRTRDGEPIDPITYTFERGGTTYEVTRSFQDGPPVELQDARGLCERGNVGARVVHDGVARECVLPAKLQVRYTAAPLVRSPHSRIGTAPLTREGLAPGSYLLLVRAPGHEDQRVPFVLARGGTSLVEPTLLQDGSTPEGFVFVPGGKVAVGGDRTSTVSDPRREEMVEDFFIQEREVTFLEYFRFLNDPGTRAEVESSSKMIRLPRRPENLQQGGYLQRDESGKLKLWHKWVDWPIMGVSQDDVRAYVKWRNAKAKASGERVEYAIPKPYEWEKAARGVDERLYPFGNRLDPAWAKLLMSRKIRSDTPYDVQPEPVLSFAADESPYGVFDLAGSQAEWLEGLLSKTSIETSAEYRGGSWVLNDQQSGRATARAGMSPESAAGHIGFRLAAHRVNP